MRLRTLRPEPFCCPHCGYWQFFAGIQFCITFVVLSLTLVPVFTGAAWMLAKVFVAAGYPAIPRQVGLAAAIIAWGDVFFISLMRSAAMVGTGYRGTELLLRATSSFAIWGLMIGQGVSHPVMMGLLNAVTGITAVRFFVIPLQRRKMKSERDDESD